MNLIKIANSEVPFQEKVKNVLKMRGSTIGWLADQIPLSRIHLYNLMQNSANMPEKYRARINEILETEF
jgi:hypothetical protein